nr:unnamed protein product [Callosobruchus analis]
MDLANEFKKLEEHFTKSMDAFNGRLKQAMTADKPEVRELLLIIIRSKKMSCNYCNNSKQ